MRTCVPVILLGRSPTQIDIDGVDDFATTKGRTSCPPTEQDLVDLVVEDGAEILEGIPPRADARPRAITPAYDEFHSGLQSSAARAAHSVLLFT